MRAPPRDKRPLRKLGAENPYTQTDPHAVELWLRETEDVARVSGRKRELAAPSAAEKKARGGEAYHGHILDLHGYSRDQAYQALIRFMHAAASQRLKNVRIITGKGRGVLQRDVPLWLESMPQVTHYGQADRAQGGDGALNVSLQWV